MDQLVLLCGEVSYRVNYEKDDKLEKKNPTLGDLNFTVREVYPVGEALEKLSDGLRIRLEYADPELKRKVAAVRDLAARHPGGLGVFLELAYPGGTTVEVDLGEDARVSVTMAFLSELAKLVPQADTSFRPSAQIYLAPPKPKPWALG